MKTISIVGSGRFGQVLFRLLKDDFTVTMHTRSSAISDIYKSEVIFFAVPIDAFERVIKSHKRFFRPEHVLIDVLSVKLHPKKVFEKYLKGTNVQAILTHPMFGPDSSKEGFDGLPIVMDQFKASDMTFAFWKSYFSNKGLQVIEMLADEHDKIAADSQGLTHFIGRLLQAYGIKPTIIDTLGSKKLLEILDQTCNDTWQLFINLQQFNPYTKRMRTKIGDEYDHLYNSLLPKTHTPGKITIGIQGGKGSFNEQAILEYVKNEHITKYTIVYLYTSGNVLKALHTGDIDLGQFAVHNSVGGIVQESIQAMAEYKFKIVKEFAVKIAHCLMTHPDTMMTDISAIMTHPQVLAQCKETLSRKFPQLKQTSGTGILLDHAVVARHLSQGKLPKTIATMGSVLLAKLYNLKIIEEDLQDAKENYTSFLIVSR